MDDKVEIPLKSNDWLKQEELNLGEVGFTNFL
jgi:hypothetical protein